MPDLLQSLQGRDLGYLRIVAEMWGVLFSAPDAKVGLQRLAPLLLDRHAASEAVQDLPPGADLALQELLSNEGRLPWAQFTRRFGVLREMGPARRDRERPYENLTASATEALWYRALLARGFFDTPNGPEEFAYIPDDLLLILPARPAARSPALGRPATPAERAVILPASDRILDDAATLLAALRVQPEAEGAALQRWFTTTGALSPYPLTRRALKELLRAAGLLDASGAPLPKPSQQFLEAERGEALAMLVRAWLRSTSFDELRLVPSLVAEGEWRNDPLRARHALLDFLSTVPGGLRVSENDERPFWSLGGFVHAIRQAYPDYQRSGGEYDSWYLRPADGAAGEAGEPEYLRGFEHWEAVDGELVRFLVSGPLHWLGLVDLGLPAGASERQAASAAEAHPPATAFRYSAWASDLLSLKAPEKPNGPGGAGENEAIIVSANGRVHVPARAPRAARYQVARFAAWDRLAKDIYHYRLTPASLELARKQGLNTAQLVSLLRRYSQGVPAVLVQALERWEAQGSQARLEQMTVLRVRDPELLAALRSSRAARFLGDLLGPTVVAVKPGAVDKVLDVLAEMGYLGEVLGNSSPE